LIPKFAERLHESSEVQFEALHVRVRSANRRSIASQHLEVAGFEAMKAVTNRVKAMTGLDNDGAALMAGAFADQHPLIDLADPLVRNSPSYPNRLPMAVYGGGASIPQSGRSRAAATAKSRGGIREIGVSERTDAGFGQRGVNRREARADLVRFV
jgi:hypothetical protein